MSNDQYTRTRLTASDLKAIELEAQAEISALPPIETTITVSWRSKALGTISAFGAVITLTIVEFIRSFGAVLLAVLFAMLEYERVRHGALALGQVDSSAVLIAFAVVCANIVHPIYVLRAHARQADLYVTRQTVRGMLGNIGNRLFAPSSTRKVDNTHNPTLSASAFIITITTIILAVYDVLSPLITQLATGQATKPTIILISEFIMGLGLSIGGVLMLQAIAHEIALRAFDFDTRSPQELMAEARAQRNAQIADIRERVKASYMQAKISDEQRKKAGAGNGMVKAITPISAIGNEGDVLADEHNHTNGITNGAGKHTDFLAVNGNGLGHYSNGNGNGNS